MPGLPPPRTSESMRGTLVILLSATCILWLTSTAQARMPRTCSYAQPAKSELKCGKRNLWHATSLARFLRAHTNAGTRSIRESLWRDSSWLKRYAKRHIARALQRMVPPIPHKSGWLCIHSYEGSWTDSDDPYWGGLQMDRGFMTTYGSDFIRRFGGYANVWPVWAQMTAAERAYSGYGGHKARYYGPWPNTARYCGLL
jgi:hypothetical protein